MKDEEVNKCEFCGEIKSVSRYYIRIKNKHFDDNKKGKYSTYISYCNDCGIEPMLSSKHHSYLTDRVKEFDSNFYIRHEVDCASEYVPMPLSPEYEKFVPRKCDCGTDELVERIRAFLTETIEQSMEVGRQMEKERIRKLARPKEIRSKNKRLSLGLCYDCNSPRLEGNAYYCWEHREKHNKRNAKARAKLKVSSPKL